MYFILGIQPVEKNTFYISIQSGISQTGQQMFGMPAGLWLFSVFAPLLCYKLTANSIVVFNWCYTLYTLTSRSG